MKSRIEPLQKNTHTHIQNLTNCFYEEKRKKRSKLFIPDIPALRQPEMTSTDRDLGPRVPTIFVIAGKKLCKIQSNSDPRTNESRKKKLRLTKWTRNRRSYRFGWFENRSHSDWLLEKQVTRMHLRWSVIALWSKTKYQTKEKDISERQRERERERQKEKSPWIRGGFEGFLLKFLFATLTFRICFCTCTVVPLFFSIVGFPLGVNYFYFWLKSIGKKKNLVSVRPFFFWLNGSLWDLSTCLGEILFFFRQNVQIYCENKKF